MTASHLLHSIMNKGGITGECAKMYQKDYYKRTEFILECAEQCHTPVAQRLWGKELINDIIGFKNTYEKNFKKEKKFSLENRNNIKAE